MQIPASLIPLPFDIPGGTFTPQAIQCLLAFSYLQPVIQAVDGAIDSNVQQRAWITKNGVAQLTTSAPTVGLSDNQVIELVSTTDFAHTLTATGLLMTGSANKNKATFAAKAGASLRLAVYGGKFYVLASTQITFS